MATLSSRLIWVHNSFLGHARMMETQAQTIINSSTATSTSKALAREIQALAHELQLSLKQRVDPS